MTSTQDCAEPALSVVMTTFNGGRFLEEQLTSICEQLGPLDEIIVSDDGSSDDTLDVLAKFSAMPVRVLHPGGNLGPIRNFEYAMGHATKPVLVLSDQDDVWLPGRLQRIRAFFRNCTAPHALLVLNSIIVDGSLKPTNCSLFEYLNAGQGLAKNLWRNTYVGCHMAFKASLLEVALPLPPKVSMHDVWLGLVSEMLGPVTFDAEPTMLFRRSGQNYTQASYPLVRRVSWRLNLAWSLLRLRTSRRFVRRRQPAIER